MCCDFSAKMSTPVKEEIDENYNLDLIKDEAAACNEEPILKFEVSEEKLMLPITRPTLVYTTRIDDMNILNKNLHEYNCKEVVKMVLAESKPKYSNHHTSAIPETDLLGHVKVLSFVEQINCKAKLEAQSVKVESDTVYSPDHVPSTLFVRELLSNVKVDNFAQDINLDGELDESVSARNQRLIKQCKPLSVLLEDFRINRSRLRNISEVDSHSQRDSSPDDNVALIGLKTKDSTLNVSQNKTVLLALVHDSKEAYICRFNIRLKAITDYYVINKYNDDEFMKMYPDEPINVRYYCCWYKRETVIEMLALGSLWTCPKKTTLLTMKQFLKQPHACPPGGCLCCCRVADKKSIKRTLPPYTPVKRPSQLIQSISLQPKTIKGVQASEIVRNAISYQPGKPKTVKSAKISNKPKNTGLILLRLEMKEEKDPIIDLSDGDGTNLRVPVEFYVLEGDIINTFTVNDKEEADKIETTYISMLLPVIKKVYCCWYSRENVITCLRIQKFSTNVLKYLRTSHNCGVNKCKCCCKPKMASGLEKLIRAREKTYTHWPAVLNHTTVYNKTPNNVTVPPAVTPTIRDQSKSTDDVTESPQQTQRSVSNIREEDKNILDKFKTLKISVDSEGELEAVLDSPARNLSIMELKVLHHILTLSSKQIAKMQISPVEFCRRVNSKKTGDISFTPVIDQKQINEAINVKSVLNKKQTNDVANVHSVVNKKQTNDVVNLQSVANQKQKKDVLNVQSRVTQKPTNNVMTINPIDIRQPINKVINIQPVANQNYINDKSKVTNILSEVTLEKLINKPQNLSNILIQQNITPNKPTMRATRGGDMYAELAHLLRVKNTHLGNSFSINYKSGLFSQSIPKLRVFPKIARSTLSGKTTKSESPVSDPQIPNITNVTPIPDKQPFQESSDVNGLLRNALTSVECDLAKKKELDQSNGTNLKRKTSPVPGKEDKRIRVKPPSELIDHETIPKTIPFAPISNSQITNNVLYSQNLASVVQNTTSVNLPGSAQTILVKRTNQPVATMSNATQSMNSVASSLGTKWLTLSPMPTQNDSEFGQLLSNMLKTPHVQPAAPYFIVMPPLVPIGSAPVVLPNATFSSEPIETINIEEGQDNIDIAKITPNRPKIILEHRDKRASTSRRTSKPNLLKKKTPQK